VNAGFTTNMKRTRSKELPKGSSFLYIDADAYRFWEYTFFCDEHGEKKFKKATD
jgi:hypothetical protein